MTFRSLLSLALRLAAVGCMVVLLGCQATSSPAPDAAEGSDATSATGPDATEESDPATSTSIATDDDCGAGENPAEVIADLDGDGQLESIFAQNTAGPTVLHVCGSGLDVAAYEVGNTNKPVQLHPIDIEADGKSELLVGVTTGAGPFAGSVLRLVASELVDQRVDLAVIPPGSAGSAGSAGRSFDCVDVNDDGITDLVSVVYELDASLAEGAKTVAWTQTAVLGEAAAAEIVRQGMFDIGTERAKSLGVMNGTCRAETLVVGVTDADLPAPIDNASSPSQRAADARRDEVVLAIADLPYESRVDPLVAVGVDEGTWVLSRLTREVIDSSMADGCGFGDLNADSASEVICTVEYGEILLVDADGQIQRAYPMPGAVPSWIHITPSTVYAGRIGDGALPDSTLVRIDRATLTATVLLVPTGREVTDLDRWPTSWRIVPEDQIASYLNLVGFAPNMVGTSASSWIGDVVIDPVGIDALIDES